MNNPDNEPWYQVQGMSKKEVYDALFNCLKFKCPNQYVLSFCINKTITGVDYGSYRGYYTFLHAQFKKEVTDLYNNMYFKNKKIY
mgnify:CR=1 FL=1